MSNDTKFYLAIVGQALTGRNLLKYFITSPPINVNKKIVVVRRRNKNYWEHLFLFPGIATPFITCIPTEVSEHWFAGRQRTVITAVLGMGDCFGLILGTR